MIILNVAEKPSVAKSLVTAMGINYPNTLPSDSKFNPVRGFPYEWNGQTVEMRVASVSGHLMNYEFDGAEMKKSWSAMDPEDCFRSSVSKTVGNRDLQTTLERHARQAQELWQWLDCDREGENICFEVVEICLRVNPRLRVKRAKFSAVTREQIQTAIRTLAPPNEAYSKAVDTRQILDLRIGSAFTRQQTLLLNKLGLKMISYGTCQIPTLAFVVDRASDIAKFKSQKFYELKLTLKILDSTTNTTKNADLLWNRVRVYDASVCRLLLEQCLEYSHGLVNEHKTQPKTKYKPYPLNTIELQKCMNTYLKMSSQNCLLAAEKQYHKGIISYPRSDTQVFSRDIPIKTILGNFEESPVYGSFTKKLLHENLFQWPSAGPKDDKAHPPIHPLIWVDNLTDPHERDVYEFIVRHFLACCSPHAQGDSTNLGVTVGGEQFHTQAITVKAKNYLEIYKYDKWAEKAQPVVQVGDLQPIASLHMHESKTSPPQYLTESEILSLMDKYGIGTDATMASHIETIKKRAYAEVIDGKLQPTKLGTALIEVYKLIEPNLVSPLTRGEMEKQILAIGENQATQENVLSTSIQVYRAMYDKIRANQENILDYCKQHITAEDIAQIVAQQERQNEKRDR